MLWTVAGQGASVVLGFTSSIVLARWLGPEARGFYALILTTTLLLATLQGNNGVTTAAMYLIGKGVHRPNQTAAHALWITAAGFVVLLAIVAWFPSSLAEALLPDLGSPGLWLAASLTLPLLLNGILTGILVGLNEIRLATLFSVGSLILDLCLQVIFLIVLD